MADKLREKGTYVASLGSAVMKGGEALGNVPELLKIVLSEGAWREFVTVRGETVRYERFSDFATTPPLHGIGADVALLKRIVGDDPVAIDLLDRAMEGKWGGDRKSADAAIKMDNVQLDTPTGNTSDAAIRRLRNHAVDTDTGEILDENVHRLYTRVLAGELSPNAAAIQAGFRRRMLSIPVEDASRAAKSIRANASPEFVRELIRYLDGGG